MRLRRGPIGGSAPRRGSLSLVPGSADPVHDAFSEPVPYDSDEPYDGQHRQYHPYEHHHVAVESRIVDALVHDVQYPMEVCDHNQGRAGQDLRRVVL